MGTSRTPDTPSRPEIHDRHGLVLLGLAERVAQRGTAVAQPGARGCGADLLRPVQMTQRHVVDTVEHITGNGAETTDTDVALGIADPATRHPGVRQNHGPRCIRPVGQVGTDPVHGCAQYRSMRRRQRLAALGQRVAGRVRMQVGDRIHPHHTGLVGEVDTPAHVFGTGPQEQAVREQPGAIAQAAKRIVVAGRDHRGGDGQQRAERVLEQLEGFGGGHGVVEHVPGDDDQVHVLVGGDAADLGHGGALRVQQSHLVQRAAEVPVGRVQDPHHIPLRGACLHRERRV